MDIGVETPSPKSFWGGFGDDREYIYMCIACIYKFMHTLDFTFILSLCLCLSLSHTYTHTNICRSLHGIHPTKEPSRFAHTHTRARAHAQRHTYGLSPARSFFLSLSQTHMCTHTRLQIHFMSHNPKKEPSRFAVCTSVSFVTATHCNALCHTQHHTAARETPLPRRNTLQHP